MEATEVKKKKKKKKSFYRTGLMLTVNEWVLYHNSIYNPLVFPPHITQTSLHHDLAIYSSSTGQVVILQLTVPKGCNKIQRHIKKEV